MDVIDRYNYTLYAPEQYSYTKKVEPSDFAFSFVSSSSPVNGASSTYSVSLTLSVDTPINSIARVTLPEELKFDTS
jgi:hypothetical protein